MPRKSIDKTIYLNEESCHKYDLSINEAIDLLSIDKSSNVRTTLMQLLDKKLIYPEYDANYNVKQWFLTETGKNTLVSIISIVTITSIATIASILTNSQTHKLINS